MAKPRRLNESECKAALDRLPANDRCFIGVLTMIMDAVGDEPLRYKTLPTPLERTFSEAGRDTLFSVIIEALGALLDAPALKRMKQERDRRRNGSPPRSAAKRAPAKRRARVAQTARKEQTK